MATHRLRMRDVSHFKPKKFQNHMTLTEVARETGKDPSWIRRLEARGKIPKAARVRAGELRIRLWSPEQVDEIKEILSGIRPGRPSK